MSSGLFMAGAVTGAKFREKVVPPWNPSDLIGPTEDGAWYDFRDPETLFQTTGLTLPVTSINQAIRSVRDKSGKGHDLVFQGVGEILSDYANGQYFLDFQSGWLGTPYFISGTQARTVVIRFRQDTVEQLGSIKAVFSMTDGQDADALSSDGNDWTLSPENDGLWLRVTGNGHWNISYVAGVPKTLSARWELTYGATAQYTKIRSDKVDIAYADGNDKTIDTIPYGMMAIGNSVRQTGSPFDGAIAQVFVINRALSDAEVLQVENYFETGAAF